MKDGYHGPVSSCYRAARPHGPTSLLEDMQSAMKQPLLTMPGTSLFERLMDSEHSKAALASSPTGAPSPRATRDHYGGAAEHVGSRRGGLIEGVSGQQGRTLAPLDNAHSSETRCVLLCFSSVVYVHTI